MQTQDNTTEREEIIDFKAEHIDLMKIANKDKNVFKIPHMLKAYEELGGCYTFKYDGEYLCSAGIITYWNGVGEAWIVLADNIDIGKHLLCATIKKYIDNSMESSFNRLHAAVKVDDEKSIRFVEWLGFKRQVLMEKYGLEGADYYLYARI